MDEMVMFTKAVANGRQNALIVADLPNKSYENEADAVSNSERLINAGADAVKLEGRLSDIIKAIIKAGIPVMGHLGLLPQTAKGHRRQGLTKKGRHVLLEDAKALQEAGCFSIVFEMVAADTMYAITEAVSVPTIGIGCGKDCDGQVLVIHDMLGLFEKFQPSFVKRYLSLSEQIRKAVDQYVKDVEDVTFPAAEHCFRSGIDRQRNVTVSGMSFDGYFGAGIESGFKICCIFFFIYCRSIFDHDCDLDDIILSEDMKRFDDQGDGCIIDKKLQEEYDNILSEIDRKIWFEGVGDCWSPESKGYIRCPDCIAKELKAAKKANTLNQFRDIPPRFLKEQK
jgi:3-methyl-2-oxobutanoate hydroxymethyltransferase